MRILTVGSVRGAPGVTTTAQLLAAGIKGAVLVEADLAGSVIAVRYGLGREPGLTTLVAVDPDEPDGWRAHAQDAGGVPVLVGPDAPEASESLWRTAADRLASILRRGDAPAAVVDVGRLSATSPMLSVSDLLVVLIRPVAEHLVALTHRLPSLRQAVDPAPVVVVLVGSGPYGESDIGPQLGVDVIGHLPDDRHAADLLLRGGASPAGFARTRLARSAAGLCTTVAEHRDADELKVRGR